MNLKTKILFEKKMKSPLGIIQLVADETSMKAIALDKPYYEYLETNEDHPVLNECERQLIEYFKGQRFEFDLPLVPEGTEFQKKSWSALIKIPYGKTWSYGQQAKYIGAPKAYRAVGGANGCNPLPIVIPCHRVIGSNGHLTGFAGGIEIKEFLLNLEKQHIKTDLTI